MKFIVLATALSLVLSSCASTQNYAASGDNILKSIGDTYVGRPVTDMARRFGVPQEQKEFGGQRVYLWHANHQLQNRQPVTSNTTGTVAGYGVLAPSVQYKSRTTTDQIITTPVSCTLTAYADQNDVIVTVGLNGKLGACDLFGGP